MKISYDKIQNIFIFIHYPFMQTFSIYIPNRMIYKSILMMIAGHHFYIRAGHIFYLAFSSFSDILDSECIV